MTGAARFCESCGVPLAPGARFCEACGAPVVQAPAVSSSQATIHEPPREEATGRPPGCPRTPRKGLILWASAAAAIFLAAIGGYFLLGRGPARLTPAVTTSESSRSVPSDASPTRGDARSTEIEQAAPTPTPTTAVPASAVLPPKPLGFEALGEVGETVDAGIKNILAVFTIWFDGPVREGDVAELDILANGTSLGAAIEALGKREYPTPDNLRIKLSLEDILRTEAKFLPDTGIIRFQCILAMRGGKRIVAPSAFDFLKWEEVPEASFGGAASR